LDTTVLLEILREDMVHLLRLHPRLDYNFVRITEAQIEEACKYNSKEVKFSAFTALSIASCLIISTGPECESHPFDAAPPDTSRIPQRRSFQAGSHNADIDRLGFTPLSAAVLSFAQSRRGAG
jgi:hypothetical protein